MSHVDNPFWNANATPDRMATAVVAVIFWLALAAALLAFAPAPLSVILALLLAAQAFRTWRRFRSRPPKS